MTESTDQPPASGSPSPRIDVFTSGGVQAERTTHHDGRVTTRTRYRDTGADDWGRWIDTTRDSSSTEQPALPVNGGLPYPTASQAAEPASLDANPAHDDDPHLYPAESARPGPDAAARRRRFLVRVEDVLIELDAGDTDLESAQAEIADAYEEATR